MNPEKLSPIHFSTDNPEEQVAYTIAYQKLLDYYQRDPKKAHFFGEMLFKALYKKDSRDLLNWYELHQISH